MRERNGCNYSYFLLIIKYILQDFFPTKRASDTRGIAPLMYGNNLV